MWHRTGTLRPLLIIVSVALAVTACRPSDRPSRAPTLTLTPCRIEGQAARCGTLEVFENRAAATGRKLSLSVAVLPALSASPLPDPVFLLAGGPGQAASDIVPMVAPALEKIRRERDLVFVDQRGTGRSHPLDCDDDEKLPLAERLRTEFDEVRLDECLKTLERKADLRFYGTGIAIDDLDEVRHALGYERINLWGGSYGTRVGLAYLRRYPQRTRSAVLDGVAPMSLLLPVDVAKDSERALTLLFEQCAGDAACDAAWPNLKAKFDALLLRLKEAPATTTVSDPLTGEPASVTITRDLFTRIVRALLYQSESTTLIPMTIARAADGDFRPLVGQAELVRTMSEGLASVGMHYSVVCTEDRPFFDLDGIDEVTRGTFLGRELVDETIRVCDRWPRGDVPPGFREPVASDVPVLLLSGELDPVTPPRWADDAARTLSKSVHVVVSATGHGTLGSACIRKLTAQFIAAGTVEGLDTECDADARRPPFFTTFAGPPP